MMALGHSASRVGMRVIALIVKFGSSNGQMERNENIREGEIGG